MEAVNNKITNSITNKKSSYTKGQFIGLITGILAFIIIYFLLPIDGLSKEGRGVLATLALVGCFWMTEAVDTGIAGLIPLVLFPLTQSLSASATAAAYGSNTVFMFFGGFAIALALEKWNLHNRIALSIINVVGTSMTKLIIGLMFSATFISMWVSNTATALMLLPIAQAIGSKISELIQKEENYSEKDCSNFRKSTIFAVGFGATIGGSLTLIGTPTNITLNGFVSEILGFEIPFAKFVLFEFPIAAVQFVITVFLLTKVFYKISMKEVKQGKEYVREEKEALGKMSYEEKIVSAIFIVTIFMWLTVTFIWEDIIPGMTDTIISIIACIILFIVPSKNTSGRILNGDSIKRMPWGVILMLMGGMAIAAGFTKTDLAQWIGNQLLSFQDQSALVVIAIVTFISLLVTQFAPNTATGTIMVPIAASLAQAININPLYLMTAAALGCGFAFTFPCGTPVMGIIYGTQEYKMSELVKVGISIVLASLVMIVLVVRFLIPVFFGV